MLTTDSLDVTPQRQFADDLRQLARFYDDHPGFPIPLQYGFSLWPSSVSEVQAHAKEMRPVKRKDTKEYLKFTKSFGTLELKSILCKYSCCKQVVVGERIVEAQPAVEEHTENIYEYECVGTEEDS